MKKIWILGLLICLWINSVFADWSNDIPSEFWISSNYYWTSGKTLIEYDCISASRIYSPDGRFIATISPSRGVELYLNQENDTPVYQSTIHMSPKYETVAFTQTSQYILIRGEQHIVAYDLTDPENPVIFNQIEVNDYIKTFVFSSVNQWLLAPASPWIESTHLYASLTDMAAPVINSSLFNLPCHFPTLSQNSQLLVTSDYDNYHHCTSHIINMTTPESPEMLSTISHDSWFIRKIISPNGKWLMVLSKFSAQLFNLSKPEEPVPLQSIVIQLWAINAIAFSHDDQYIAMSAEKQDNFYNLYSKLVIYDLSQPDAPREVFSQHKEGNINSLDFHPSSNKLLIGYMQGQMEEVTYSIGSHCLKPGLGTYCDGKLYEGRPQGALEMEASSYRSSITQWRNLN